MQWIRQLRTSSGLAARAARGASTLAAGGLAEGAARFIRNLVLARLLAPEHFGLMAIVLAASQLFEAFTDVGVRYCVIQNRRGETPELLNAAWWFSAARGVLLFAVGFLAAPVLAWVYAEPRLTELLRCTLISVLLAGLISPRLYVLQKRMQLGGYVAIMQGAGVAGIAITLGLAYWLQSVWALALGFVAESALRTALSQIILPLRPRWPIDRQSGRDLWAFARGMAGLALLTFIIEKIEIFVVGKLCPSDVLGAYALAIALADVPLTVFSRLVQPLIMPAFSQLQHDAARLCDAVCRATEMLMRFGLPLAACALLFGRPILAVVYGPPYDGMAAPFGLACGYRVLTMAGVIIASLYIGVGQPGLHRAFTLVRGALAIGVIYPAVLWLGPTGAVLGLLATQAIALGVQAARMHGLIRLPLSRYLASLGPGLAPTAIVLAAGGLVRWIWAPPDLMQVAACVALCGAAWAWTAWRLQGGLARNEPASASVAVQS
jgi:O-antigen/teichoic acid export membrane protein